MSRTYPWNSVKENHHHNNTRCGPGSEIPPHNRLMNRDLRPRVHGIDGRQALVFLRRRCLGWRIALVTIAQILLHGCVA